MSEQLWNDLWKDGGKLLLLSGSLGHSAAVSTLSKCRGCRNTICLSLKQISPLEGS